MQNFSVIDSLFIRIQLYFEKYGWPFVFCAIILYVLRPRINNYLRERSLAVANDPKRRKVLDTEVRKIRVHQQLDVFKAAREAKEAKELTNARAKGR
jgi:F0F1-type ATP synthase membrane subunit b/b'